MWVALDEHNVVIGMGERMLEAAREPAEREGLVGQIGLLRWYADNLPAIYRASPEVVAAVQAERTVRCCVMQDLPGGDLFAHVDELLDGEVSP
jgi:alpha-D-ribose 1-methylphosphonate 5-triphosphate synthase subunit PhnI